MADEVIVGERHSYYIIQVKEEGETLYEAITEAGLDYVKGHGYYQLGNKRENVNASKQLVWYNGEECVDDSSAVRERLGLGEGKIRVSQRDLEEGSLFIQSTSANRGLRKKTACLFIASSAVATKAVKSGKKSAKKAKRKPSKSKGKKMEEEGKEEDADEDESKGQVDVIKGSKHSYYLVQVEDDKVTLEDAISTAGLQYSRGSGYYQLGRKKEAISAKKDMVWYDGDEVIDVSKDIRQKFGMGMGKIKINHNDIDEGSLFVQSTSANRGLIRGSACLLLDDNALAPSKAKSKGKKRVAGKSNATIGGPKAKKQRTKLQTSKAPKKSSNGKGKSSIGPILSIGETKKVTRGVPGTFPFGLEWEDCGDLFYSLDSNKIQPSEKVVAFDMDGTLIEPKSGSKFARNRTDWRWLFDNVPTKLKGLYNAGYKIVIFTNQAGIEKSRTNASDIQGKILDLSKELGFPLVAFIAGGTNHYRKPHARMWRMFVEVHNGGVEPSSAVFVGDAGGRPINWKPKKKRDFSCSDRKFAYNSKLNFFTPEEFFLKQEKAKFLWGGFDPEKFLANVAKREANNPIEPPEPSDSQEMIVFVGPPASGKSHISKTLLKGYVRVNRDTLKTQSKCHKAAEKALSEGKSVVIDNTSPSASVRAPYIAVAQKFNVSVRCWNMQVNRALAEHLNFVREGYTDGARRRVPGVGYGVYYKNYETPDTDEGFEEVVDVEFSPDFSDSRLEELFLEKS